VYGQVACIIGLAMNDNRKTGSYRVKEMAAADEARRNRDIEDIQSGRRSAEEVRRQNGALFRALGKPSIDISRSRLA